MLGGRWCCGFRYSVVDFVEKNRDDLNQNLQDLVAASGSAFIRSQLFSPTLGEDSGATPVAPAGSAAASRQSKRTQVCGTRQVWDGRRSFLLGLPCVCVCACVCLCMWGPRGLPASPWFLPFPNVAPLSMESPCVCLFAAVALFVCLFVVVAVVGFFPQSGKFRGQLDQLMLFLERSQPHFIRCIKPNAQKSPMVFHAPDCLKQLVCAGVPQAVKILQKGAYSLPPPSSHSHVRCASHECVCVCGKHRSRACVRLVADTPFMHWSVWGRVCCEPVNWGCTLHVPTSTAVVVAPRLIPSADWC
jgi:hypothetical protein